MSNGLCIAVDYAWTTLYSGTGAPAYIAGVSTEVVIAEGEGMLFGSPTPEHPIRISLIRANAVDDKGQLLDPSKIARFLATGRSGDTLTGLTLVGGVDQDFATDDFCAATIEADAINDLNNAIEGLRTSVGDLTTQVGDIDTTVDGLTTQVGDLTTQVGDLTTQVGDIDTGKADDALVVHLTGPEDITGSKTFAMPTIGPFLDKGGEVYDVRAYGAKGDGVTDDTAAIQAAITAAPRGSTVYFPTGRYMTHAALLIAKDLNLRGAGGSAMYIDVFGGNWDAPAYQTGSVLLSTLASGYAIDCSVPSPAGYLRLGMEDLLVIGLGDATRTTTAIRVGPAGTTAGYMAAFYAVDVANFATAVEWNFVENSHMVDCWFMACTTGVKCQNNTNANVFMNTSTSACGTGYHFTTSGANTLIGGAIQGSSVVGVLVDVGSDENTIRGVYFESNNSAAHSISCAADALVIDLCHFGLDGDDVVLTGNANKIIAGKYTNALTISGSNNIIFGQWAGGITDTGAGTVHLDGLGVVSDQVKARSSLILSGASSTRMLSANGACTVMVNNGGVSITGSVGGGMVLSSGVQPINLYSNFLYPSNDNAVNLGGTASRWMNVYAMNVDTKSLNTAGIAYSSGVQNSNGFYVINSTTGTQFVMSLNDDAGQLYTQAGPNIPIRVPANQFIVGAFSAGTVNAQLEVRAKDASTNIASFYNSTGGVGMMVSASGKVGIVTKTPTTAMSFANGAFLSFEYVNPLSGAVGFIWSNASDELEISTSGGATAINVTCSNFKLSGAITCGGTLMLGASGTLQFIDSGGGNYRISGDNIIAIDADSIYLRDKTGAVTVAQFNATGSRIDFHFPPVLPAVAEALIPNGGIAWSTDTPGALKARAPDGTLRTVNLT